jgi:hypothetical protein
MSPTAPKVLTWILGLAFGISGIVGHYKHVQFLTDYNYLFLLAGFVILALGTTFRNL